MLATRPPNDWPPPITSCPRPEALMKTGTARSAPPRGRSTAIASMPRRLKPTTYGFIDAASPDAPWPRTTFIDASPLDRSVEVRDALLSQPFARNLYLDATYAQRAPDNFATLACNVLMILRKVQVHGECPALEAFHRTLHEKKSYQPVDVCVTFRYLNNLYGVATLGCHHRDNCARPIS